MLTLYETSKFVALGCTCPAGEFDKLCKHKRALVTGDATFLPNTPEAKAQMEQFRVVLSEKGLLKIYLAFEEELSAIEKEEKKLKRRSNAIKKAYEKAFNGE